MKSCGDTTVDRPVDQSHLECNKISLVSHLKCNALHFSLTQIIENTQCASLGFKHKSTSGTSNSWTDQRSIGPYLSRRLADCRYPLHFRSLRARMPLISHSDIDVLLAFVVIQSPGSCFCTGSARSRHLMGFEEDEIDLDAFFPNFEARRP